MAGSITRYWERRFVRFLCVGAGNTLLDFTMLNLLVEKVHLPALVANSCSVSIGITISYFLNHKVVFRHPYKYSLGGYLRFFAITGLSVLLIQDVIIYAVIHLLHIDPATTVTLAGFTIAAKTLELNLAKASAIAVGLFWNYLLYKHVVFKRSPADDADRISVA